MLILFVSLDILSYDQYRLKQIYGGPRELLIIKYVWLIEWQITKNFKY